MIVRKMCLGLALLISASSNIWAASYSILCEVNSGTDIQKVASALQGSVSDEVLDGTYLLSVSHLPGTNLPAGVQYCEQNPKASLPAFVGALVSVNGSESATWYRYQPAFRLVQ